MLFRLPVLILLGLAACAQPPATVPIRAERELVPGPPIEPWQEAQALAVLPMQFGSLTRSAEPEVIGADRALIRYSSTGASTQLSATVFLIGLGDNPPGDGPDSPRALQELERGANDALAQLRATLNPEKEGGAFNPTIQRSQGPVMRCRGRVLPLATDTVTDVLCSTVWRQRLLQIRLTQRHPHEALLAAALMNNGFMYNIFERLHVEAQGTLRT